MLIQFAPLARVSTLLVIGGHTSAVEAGQAYAVRYEISVDARWRTREVHVHNDTAHGPRSTALVSDGQGSWTVDGRRAPQLDGLYDVDLEASACTNTLPVGLVVDSPASPGASPEAPTHHPPAPLRRPIGSGSSSRAGRRGGNS